MHLKSKKELWSIFEEDYGESYDIHNKEVFIQLVGIIKENISGIVEQRANSAVVLVTLLMASLKGNANYVQKLLDIMRQRNDRDISHFKDLYDLHSDYKSIIRIANLNPDFNEDKLKHIYDIINLFMEKIVTESMLPRFMIYFRLLVLRIIEKVVCQYQELS
jgi:hypothetical protein